MLVSVFYIVVTACGDDPVAENIVNFYFALLTPSASDICFNYNCMFWGCFLTVKWWMGVKDVSAKVSS